MTVATVVVFTRVESTVSGGIVKVTVATVVVFTRVEYTVSGLNLDLIAMTE